MLAWLQGYFQGHSSPPAGMGGPGASCGPGHSHMGRARTYLWGQTVWHSRACGRRASHHAGEREGSVRVLSGDHGSLGITSIPTGVQRPPWPCLHPKMHSACWSASDRLIQPEHSRILPASNTLAVLHTPYSEAGAPAPCTTSAKRHLQAPTWLFATQ